MMEWEPLVPLVWNEFIAWLRAKPPRTIVGGLGPWENNYPIAVYLSMMNHTMKRPG